MQTFKSFPDAAPVLKAMIAQQQRIQRDTDRAWKLHRAQQRQEG